MTEDVETYLFDLSGDTDEEVAAALEVSRRERLPAGGFRWTLTPTDLLLPADLSFDEWREMGQALQQMERSVQWWLGAWWEYGERKWGELSAQAVKEMTGHERSTVWNYASVYRAFNDGETSRAREELSFRHHMAVAPVARDDPARAAELLSLAVERSLTSDELRDEVKRAAREKALGKPAPDARLLPCRIDVADAADLPLADGSVDLIVTSPPYGLEIGYADSRDAFEEWPRLLDEWLRESYRVARLGSRLALNIPLDTTLGGFRPTFPQAVQSACFVGWTYRSSIVWNEGNVSKSTARGSVDSAASPHIIAPVEMVALFSKGPWGRTPPCPSDLDHLEWLDWTSGLWTLPGESSPWEGHPAAFPEQLAYRLVRLLSFPGDTVLDPFCGSGTSVIVAHKLGRQAIGFDISETYVRSARRRLAREVRAA